MKKRKIHAVCDFFEKHSPFLTKIKGQRRGRYTINGLLPKHVFEIDDVDDYDEEKKYSDVFNMGLYVTIDKTKFLLYSNMMSFEPIGNRYSVCRLISKTYGSLDEIYQDSYNHFDIFIQNLNKSHYATCHIFLHFWGKHKSLQRIGELVLDLPDKPLTPHSTAYVPLWDKTLEPAFKKDKP